jgi:hypothetical protein
VLFDDGSRGWARSVEDSSRERPRKDFDRGIVQVEQRLCELALVASVDSHIVARPSLRSRQIVVVEPAVCDDRTTRIGTRATLKGHYGGLGRFIEQITQLIVAESLDADVREM